MQPSKLRPSHRAIHSARMRAGLSIEELSEATGIHRGTLYKIESGTTPRIGTVRKLAPFLGVEVAALLEDAAA